MITRRAPRFRPTIDRLDARLLLTATSLTPASIRAIYGLGASPGFTVNGRTTLADGRGETIAIVAIGDDPTIFNDLDTFDSKYGTGTTTPSLYSAYGSSHSFLSEPIDSALPRATPSYSTSAETALDIEYAHAIAPAAKIDLVEVNVASYSGLSSNADLAATLALAANYAASLPGVAVVSESYGVCETTPGFNLSSTLETALDHNFTTPAGHTPVTFIAATGDSGSIYNPNTQTGGPAYPSTSPNVLAVGGSTLLYDNNGNFTGESGWSSPANSPYPNFAAGASGGGISAIEARPSYQNGIQTSGGRTVPDVSYNAGTPVNIVNSYITQGLAAALEEGTSAGAPQWAGLIAIADEGRSLVGKANLNGPTQVLPAVYSSTFAADFHDITTGASTGNYAPRTGYDLVTGVGTPVELSLLTDLVNKIGSAPGLAPAVAPSPAFGSGPIFEASKAPTGSVTSFANATTIGSTATLKKTTVEAASIPTARVATVDLALSLLSDETDSSIALKVRRRSF